MLQTLDKEGNVMEKEKDKNRFMEGRAGDNLITPFQCELCHFRNIMERDPIAGNGSDQSFMEHIRRVSLDAFWGRERSTVKSNLGLVKRAMLTENKFGAQNKLIPAIGPFPLSDVFGMGAAVLVLDKSMDTGRYQDRVQWATFRKMRSTLNNLSQAGIKGLGDAVGASDKNRTWITDGDTNRFFFVRFATGIHRRVGEDVRRDEPISIGVIREVHLILSERWDAETKRKRPSRDRLLRMALTGYWFIVGFCTAIRGEENCLIEFAGTLASLEDLDAPVEGLPRHFCSVITGPTKGDRVSGAKFAVPCVAVTQGSKLEPGVWALRYCRLLKQKGQVDGYLFPDNLGAYDDMFYSMVEAVQLRRTDLIKPKVDVREAFGIFRSLRRGAASHATNMGIDRTLIDAVNRWRTERNSQFARLDMAETYSRLDTLKPTVLKYSDGF